MTEGGVPTDEPVTHSQSDHPGAWLNIPPAKALIACGALASGVMLALSSGLIQALTFEESLPAGLQGPIQYQPPAIRAADRLAMFTRSAGLTPAFVVVLAVVVLVLAHRTPTAVDRLERRARGLTAVVGALAGVIAVANVATAVELLTNALGPTSGLTGNHAAGLLQLLAPTILAVAVVRYAWVRLHGASLPA